MLEQPYRTAARLGFVLVLLGLVITGMAAGTTMAVLEVDNDCEQTIDVGGLDSEPKDCEQTMAQLGSWTNSLLVLGVGSLGSGGGMVAYVQYTGGGADE